MSYMTAKSLSFKINRDKVRRRWRYYIIWTPIWFTLTYAFLNTSPILYILQLLFILKDISDIMFKFDYMPEFFEHLPFSLATFIFTSMLLNDISLLVLALIDLILDTYEDLCVKKDHYKWRIKEWLSR